MVGELYLPLYPHKVPYSISIVGGEILQKTLQKSFYLLKSLLSMVNSPYFLIKSN